jgi:foldase protein PrsA
VKIRIRIKAVLLLLLTFFTVMLTGCSSQKESYIVSINDKKLYLEDFLYDIYLVEQDGNQLEQYYQKNLGCSYWDYDYHGTSMRQIAKNSILAGVVMNYILADQADKNGSTFTAPELSDQESAIDAMIQTSSQEKLNNIGLTREVLSTSYLRNSLAEKYRNELEKDFKIDEAKIRDSIDSEGYNSEEYEKAVKDAIETKKENLFKTLYDNMKSQYDITINFDYWDTVTIGSITVPED